MFHIFQSLHVWLGQPGGVGSEVVLGPGGEWVVSEGTQTGEETDLVQVTVPLHQVLIGELMPEHAHALVH